jgi:hypothetical protein
MIDIFGGRYRTCDGASRRRFLRVGALGLAGLTMPEVLRLRAQDAARGEPTKETAVIQVYLGGGPSHLDTYDLKPDAPREFRGEFSPIATGLPGVELCEMFPRQARLMDKLAVVRSLHHTTADHGAGSHWVLTGFPPAMPNPRSNDRPSVGSVVARMRGANRPGVPPFVAISRPPTFSHAAYLGPGYNPFSLDSEPEADARVRNLDPPAGLSMDRIEDRRDLLGKLDRINRGRDLSGTMQGMDRFTAEAYAMITGPAARRAFDLTREDAKLRDRYGRTRVGQGCLLARRLVEAGVTFVTVNDGDWDHHAQVFANCRKKLPPLDAAVGTLVEDLHERGLADRVLVLVWGEFGRTPRVNGGGGRDHWPGAFSALLAGGGLKTGQVIGSTGRKGEAPTTQPIRPEDVIRTVYAVLGIDPLHAFVNDAGRPMPVLNQGRPIADLL